MMFKATFLSFGFAFVCGLACAQRVGQPLLIPSRTDLCAGDTFSLQLASGSFSGNNTDKAYLITSDYGNIVDSLSSQLIGTRLVCQVKKSVVGSTNYEIYVESDRVIYTSQDRLRILNPLTGGISSTDYQYCFRHNGHLYFRYRGSSSQPIAQSNAHKSGGKLASVTDSVLNRMLAAWSDTAGAWIDFEDRSMEGVWRRHNLQKNSFVNWAPLEPNNAGGHEDYAVLRVTGLWNDEFLERPKSHFLEINTVSGDTVFTVPGGSIRLEAPNIEGAIVNWYGPNSFFSADTVLNLSRIYVKPSQLGNVYGMIAQRDGCQSDLLPYPIAARTSGLDTSLFEKGPLYKGKRYYVSRFPADWQRASEIAYLMGGNLVEIRSLQENAIVMNMRPTEQKWIGLSDTAEDRVFRYLSSDTVASFLNWAPSEPNNHLGREPFVQMRENGRWNDIFKELSIPFAIQLKETVVVSDPSDLVVCPGSVDSMAFVVPTSLNNCRLEISSSTGAFNAPRKVPFSTTGSYVKFTYPAGLSSGTQYSLRLVDTVSGLYDYPNPSYIQVGNGEHILPLLASVGDSLFIVNPYPGTTYEWYFGNAPVNANGTYLIAIADGEYYVVAKRNTCEARSTTLTYSVLGISTPITSTFHLIPNPAKDRILIRQKVGEFSTVLLYDGQGRIVRRATLEKAEEEISVGDLPRGLYSVKVQSPSGSQQQRLVLN